MTISCPSFSFCFLLFIFFLTITMPEVPLSQFHSSSHIHLHEKTRKKTRLMHAFPAVFNKRDHTLLSTNKSSPVINLGWIIVFLFSFFFCPSRNFSNFNSSTYTFAHSNLNLKKTYTFLVNMILPLLVIVCYKLNLEIFRHLSLRNY